MPAFRAVSFDFHDTVAICPTWFQLEVRHLASATRASLMLSGRLADGPSNEALDAAYRQLRHEIHEHGNEQDALGCVVTVFGRLGIECDPAEIASAIDALMRGACADLRPRPGIQDAVSHLAALGVPIGVTSNAVYHPFLEWALASFGIRDRVASVITSASCGFYKSRPEIYGLTAAALGVSVGDLVHVGDSFRFDVLPVSRLGGRAVWLNLSGVEPPEPAATLVVPSLDGLVDRLLALA